MKRKIDFIEGVDIQVCTIGKGKLEGYGCAMREEEDNCVSSTMTGQTIAYYKAERDLRKQEKQILKKEISDLEKMGVYLFPKKLACRETGFIKERFDKYLSEKRKKLNKIEKEVFEFDKRIIAYIEQKKRMKAKIAEKFGRDEDGRKLESKEV